MKKFDLFGYVNAWIKFAGEILQRGSSVIDVIRTNFVGLQIPKKNDFES
jgi:hypothetical protein